MPLVVADITADVVRKDIKHLHIAVYPPDGRVRVAAPLAMPESAIRAAVVRRLPWIRRQQRDVQAASRIPPRDIVEGESHYVLGRRYRLRLLDASAPSLRLSGHRLVMEVRPGSSHHARATALDAFYRRLLLEQVSEVLPSWLERLGLEDVDLRLRRMRTRWGTADGASRRVTLNPELAKHSPDCIEYVLVHELVHMLDQTHGRVFQETLDRELPDWRVRSDELNGVATPDDPRRP